jgi:hypothetical protein
MRAPRRPATRVGQVGEQSDEIREEEVDHPDL